MLRQRLRESSEIGRLERVLDAESRTCSDAWQEGRNEIVPWWNHFLGVLRSGYREFERQVESTGVRPAKSELVRRTILEQVGRFTLADLAQQVPAASPQLIKKILAELKHEGKVRLTGRGRGASWDFAR